MWVVETELLHDASVAALIGPNRVRRDTKVEFLPSSGGSTITIPWRRGATTPTGRVLLTTYLDPARLRVVALIVDDEHRKNRGHSTTVDPRPIAGASTNHVLAGIHAIANRMISRATAAPDHPVSELLDDLLEIATLAGFAGT